MSTSGRSVVPVLPFEWLKLVVERTRDPLPPDPPLLFGEGEPGDLRTGLGVKLIACLCFTQPQAEFYGVTQNFVRKPEIAKL